MLLAFFITAQMTLATIAGAEERGERIDFHIDRTSLSEAMDQLADQAGVQLLYPYEMAQTSGLNPVIGQYTLQEALELLFRDTEFSAGLTEDGIVTISHEKDREEEVQGKLRKSLLTSVSAFLFGSGSGVYAQDGLDGETVESDTIDTIIVTAQKRGEQSLLDVPISISVLGGDRLDSSPAQGLAEELYKVPGVSIQDGGISSGILIAIRGVSAAAGSSTVGYYVDDVPFGLVSTAILPDVSAYDLERVEVLRGPQGTLYGVNSINGVVRILTKDANLDEVEFKARGSVSGTKGAGKLNYRGDAAVSVPLISEKLAVRGVVGYTRQGGWIDNAIEEDANDGELINYRLKVNAQPAEKLSVELTVSGSRDEFGGPSFAADNGASPAITDQPITADVQSYGASLVYDFSDVTIRSSTSYAEYENSTNLDFLNVENLLTVYNAEVFSQEIQVHSTYEGPWQWSLGGIYRDAEDTIRQNLLFTVPRHEFLLGNSSESFAFFGEVTRSFFDEKLEVTAGARYFDDSTTGNELISVIPTPGRPLINTEADFDKITPRFAATFYPNDNVTFYASYSEGFRSGFDQNAFVISVVPGFLPVQADTLKNYEIGSKGSLAGGRLTYDLAVYYIDWEDIQQRLAVATAGTVVSAVINGSNASGMGVDFGFNLQPIAGLDLGGSVSWNDLRFDADVFTGGTLLFSEGERLNQSSPYTLNGHLNYEFPIGTNGAVGRLSGSVSYHAAENATVLSAGTLFKNTTDNILLARFSLAVDLFEKWTATLFVDNAFNENGVLRFNELPAFLQRPRPRTIGFQLEFQY